MATAIPVGTTARPPPGSRTTSSRASRSQPASPGLAYCGSGNSGSIRTTGTGSTGPLACHPVLAWMDLEMTGLDPSRHVIVEIATLITDDDLELVAEGPDLVVAQPN